jgi:hypothetical protein
VVDGSSVASRNGPILAHQMPLAGAVHHISVISLVILPVETRVQLGDGAASG